MAGITGTGNLQGMKHRRKGGLPPAPAGNSESGSIAFLSCAFLQHLASRAYSQGSIDSHQWALRQFVTWAASQNHPTPGGFTRATLEDYQLFLHHYRSPRTKVPLVVNTQLARIGCVRRFFAWLCRSGIIPANPATDLDLPRKSCRKLPRSLSADEIQRLLAIPNPADPFGLRDRTILELFYATGIRRTEMTNLDHGDYDATAGTLHVRQGKGGKSRMLPVGERAAAWLDRFLFESRPLFNHLPGESALFLSGYGTRFTPAYLGNWIKSLMKRCGIDKPGSCHLFRHSCATDMHRGGADIRYVQEMLGHERMETTRIYTHVHIDALREVHSRTHPHGKLDHHHDIYGCLSHQETVEFTSPGGTDLVGSDPLMVSAASSPVTSDARPVNADDARPDSPPDEDPSSGGQTANLPKPPPSSGPLGGSQTGFAYQTSTISPQI
jgi:integrase/recombinase XerD